MASYCSVRTADGLAADLAWYYPDQSAEAGRIGGLVCFHNDRVELAVDDARGGRGGRRPGKDPES